MKKEKLSFGIGFRPLSDECFKPVNNLPDVPSGSPASNPDIVERFRIQKLSSEERAPVKIVSDVHMLIHAKDYANRLGRDTLRRFMDSKQPKSSQVQDLMDSMSDDDILDTVKSRHLQSPAELLAWSQHLSEVAAAMQADYARQLEEQAAQEAEKAAASSGNESVPDA